MPVINPSGFTFQISAVRQDAQGGIISVPPKADGQEKYVVQIGMVSWTGAAYQTDTNISIYFSDGRPAVNMLMPWDVGYTFDLKSTGPVVIEITVIDRTSGSPYFATKSFQFSPVA